MRILFVITCLSYGGAEKNLLLIADYLARKGHHVAICNFNERETCRDLPEGVACYDEPKEKEWSGRLAFLGVSRRQCRFLKDTCKKERPDIIVSFLDMPNALSIICGHRLGIPVIISERADPYQPAPIFTRLLRKFFSHADGAVFQTDGAKAYYSDKLQKKSTVISNPVICDTGLTAVHDYDSAEDSIAFVGRLELKQKRQDVMLEAMKLVLEKHPHYKLMIWGNGEHEQNIRDMVKKLDLQDSVVFAGISKQIPVDICKCKIFAITSDFEGIPNALIEAMTVGMPCVSTDCSPGGARMLIDSDNGTVVPCGEPRAVADAIIKYIEDPDLAKTHGEKARSVKDRFSYDTIMSRWESYIEDIASKK